MSAGIVSIHAGPYVVSVQFQDEDVRQVLQLASPTLACLRETIDRATDQFVHRDVRIVALQAEPKDVTAAEDYLTHLIQQSTFSSQLRLNISAKNAAPSSACAAALGTSRPARTGPARTYDGYLSYQSDSKSIVQSIFEDLTDKHQLAIWMDDKDMSGSITRGMAAGVDSSHVFIPVLTLAYE
ncbi:hypothetical protein HDU83_001385, partial [Entophlyctis luteolus]